MTTSWPTQRRSGDVSYRRIIEAARIVFQAQGFAGATAREIAEKAGVKESRIWTYFESKDHLFAEAVLDALESHAAEMLIRDDLRSPDRDETPYTSFARTQLRWLAVMDEIMPLLGVAMFSSPESGAEFYRDRLVPLFERRLELSKLGLSHQPSLREDEWTSLMFLWGAHYGIAMEALISGRELDMARTAEQIADVLYRGVVETGKKS